jgi:hypothetical protein
VPTVKTTVPLEVPPVSEIPGEPPPVQVAPSPPLGILLCSWQVKVTVPVYPPVELTVAVAVALAPGAMPVAGLTTIGVWVRLKVDSVTVTGAEFVGEAA